MPFDPTTFWDRHAELVRQLSGAHHSSWTGTEFGYRDFTDAEALDSFRRTVIPPDPRQPGNGELEGRRSAVQWTGMIRYDPERVGDPLDDMLRHAGDDEFEHADLVTWRTGLRAVYQAHAELLVPEGEEYSHGQQAKWDALAGRQTESPAMIAYRGWAEATARHDLDAFIDRHEFPERLTAALKSVEAEYDDPVACAAAEAMAEQIGATHPEFGASGVLHEVGNQRPGRMLDRVAELAIEGHPLADREDAPGAVVRGLWDDIDGVLADGLDQIALETRLGDTEGVATAEQLERGTSIGTATAQAVRAEVAGLDEKIESLGTDQVAAMYLARQQMSRSAGSDDPRRRVEAKLNDRLATDRFGDDRRPARKPPSAGWPGMAPNR